MKSNQEAPGPFRLIQQAFANTHTMIAQLAGRVEEAEAELKKQRVQARRDLLLAANGRAGFKKSDRFRAMLLTSAYDRTGAKEFRADVEQFEISGEGYRPGGLDVSVTVELDADDGINLIFGAARWERATISDAAAVAYYQIGSEPADDRVIAVCDFEQMISVRLG